MPKTLSPVSCTCTYVICIDRSDGRLMSINNSNISEFPVRWPKVLAFFIHQIALVIPSISKTYRFSLSNGALFLLCAFLRWPCSIDKWCCATKKRRHSCRWINAGKNSSVERFVSFTTSIHSTHARCPSFCTRLPFKCYRKGRKVNSFHLF